ncbi:MAG TPA: alpha/beta hydrolase [Vineibacter sp.]|nr:alpha/beta hydrolase [Vineibacter sp.]
MELPARRLPHRRRLLSLLACAGALPGEALGQASTVRPALTRILPFRSAPFPYDGPGDDDTGPFFNTIAGDGRRRGRVTSRGELLWEDQAFADAGVLLHVPADFDARRPARLVVFFHGHGSSIDRVVADMQLDRQIAQAAVNAVLVAPQFAREASDSSPGKFWRPGAFSRFLDEAAARLTDAIAKSRAERPAVTNALRAAPVTLVAFSGGYKPAAFVLDRGGADARIAGVLLLDALYDEEERFARWFAANRTRSYLASLYTNSTMSHQMALMERLRPHPIATTLPAVLGPGTAAFVACGGVERHGRFALDGPPRDPVRLALAAGQPAELR